MGRAMHGVSLRGHESGMRKSGEEVTTCRETEAHWAGHIFRRTYGSCGALVLEWRSCTEYAAFASPRWTADIKRVAGSRWTQSAQDRGIWNS
ncbi:jg10429 [Pararge aegeria aegeria]|uniref:Jg10429 protein n=1 Tax=Pararge aegeria aegeria TaxID=348720 RepID=A0A8S4RFX1_9NEOP|nr:jg10429 [Pararge aegeria aegeria]